MGTTTSSFQADSLDNTSLVFVVGGQNASRDTCDSAFCYSTRVNQWMRMPSMNERRKGCAAATCRGSLFVAGGCTAGRVGVGGEQQTKATRRRRLGSVRRFDAGSCRWIDDVADMPSAGDQFALVSNEHCLFAIGNGVESRLDMRCDSWQPLSSLDCRRQCCAAVATDDCIYAAGGYTGESVHRSVEFLDLRRAQWESCAAMSSRRRNFGLALIAGSVVACGGQEELWDWNRNPLASCEAFDPSFNRWCEFAPLPDGTSYHSTVSTGDCLYSIGGCTRGRFIIKSTERSVLCYDAGRWRSVSSLPEARCDHASATLWRGPS